MLLLTVTNIVTLSPVSRLPAAVLGRIKSRLTFTNPARQEAGKRGFYTGNIPRQIRGYRLNDGRDRLVIPRGVTAQLVGILRGAGVEFKLEDRRRVLPEVDFSFLGEIHDLWPRGTSEARGIWRIGKEV